MKHPFVNLTLNAIALGLALCFIFAGLIGCALFALLTMKGRRERIKAERHIKGVPALIVEIGAADELALRMIALHVTVRQDFNRREKQELTCAVQVRYLQLQEPA